MATKYEPLRTWLGRRTTDRERISFDEVEAVLGFKLPDSARSLAQWWANVRGSHVQAAAWLDAGWRTCQVDVPGERLTFERAVQSRSAPGRLSDQANAVAGVSEDAAAFVAEDDILVRKSALRGGALRLLEDYRETHGGSLADAVAGLLNDMVIERRRQLLERFPMTGPPSGVNSADLIREDRDAR